LKHKVQNQKT